MRLIGRENRGIETINMKFKFNYFFLLYPSYPLDVGHKAQTT